ncbi:MAG TPA: nuclear transport factor 2 family protein [Gemmatimonadales bacterium]|nr:nuclear transport factor 2 family protein [Gemmatimonadales bacterium]
MRWLLLATLLALGCTVRRATPPSDAEDEAPVRVAVQQYYRDLSAQDWSGLAALFWPRATVTTIPGESAAVAEITPVEDFLRHIGERPEGEPQYEARLITEDVRIIGNLAQVWSHVEVRFVDSTGTRTGREVDSFTWAERHGEWRIAALARTPEPKGGPS